jgi:spermidine/putrescine-binding protein
MGLGIAYNPTYFDTPPDWKDFWDPKVAGKIATATFPVAIAKVYWLLLDLWLAVMKMIPMPCLPN